MNKQSLYIAFILAFISTQTHAEMVKEYIAMAPTTRGLTLEWILAEYSENVTNAKDVKLQRVTSEPADLGSWYGLDKLPTKGFALTGRIVGDSLYALLNINTTSGGGCCADTLRIFEKSPSGTGPGFKDIKLDPLVQEATGTEDAHVSHTLDVSMLNGTLVAFLNVKYLQYALGNAYGNAIIAVNTKTGKIIETLNGKQIFDIYQEAGTLLESIKETRFKIGFYVDNQGGEQWHGNGILHFENKNGTSLMAFTHRSMSEAIIFKSPYIYSYYQGGGTILQRFGTPYLHVNWQTSMRHFGLKTTETVFDTGVHNVWYSSDSQALDGAESISLFVNSQGAYSAAFEFALKLVEEGSPEDTGDDTVFDTEYVHAQLDFKATAQGGARAVGNGVFFVMAGSDPTGFEVADVHGNIQSIAYPKNSTHHLSSYDSALGSPNADQIGLYDPFIRVIATTQSTEEEKIPKDLFLEKN